MHSARRFQARRFLNRLTVVAVALAAAAWLFGDTVNHYRTADVDPHIIRFAHFGSYQDYELWRRIIDDFETAYPGLHVRQEFSPGWYGQYETKLRRQILSGTLPQVVLMQLAPFTALANHFAAVTETGPDAHFDLTSLDPTALAAFTIKTKDAEMPQLRALPVSGGTLAIYCNPECFAKAAAYHNEEIPLPDDDWTMAEFAAVAQRLTCDFDNDGQLDQFGFWRPRWVYYLPFIWSFGAEVLDESQTRWTLTGPEAENAFAFYRSLARDNRVCPRPSEVPQLIQDLGFLTGKVAMCINGPWFEPFLTETRLADSYHVVAIPTGPGERTTRVTWDGLCVAANLPETQEQTARKFVQFCVSKPAQDMIAETGRALPALRASMTTFDRNGSDQRRRKFVEAASYARLQPRTAHFNEIDRVVDRHLQRFIADDSTLSPGEFLTNLANDRLIKRTFPADPDHVQ